MGTRWRITALAAAAMIVVLTVLGVGVVLLDQRGANEDIQARLESEAASVSKTVTERGIDPLHLPVTYETGSFFLFWDRQGNLLSAPPGVRTELFAPAARSAAESGHRIDVIRLSEAAVLVDSRLAADREGKAIGVIQTASPLSLTDAIESRLLASVAVAGGAALLIAGLAAWLIGGRASRPIAAALARQRQFTADASHELRTPLSVIDASLQVLQRHPEQTVAASSEIIKGAQREVSRIASILDDLLTLARTEADAVVLLPRSTDVGALLGQVADEVSTRASESGHPIHVEVGPPIQVTVDPEVVRRVLLIVLDNAFVHTPAGTSISMGSRVIDKWLHVEVADEGPGIPEAEREAVFDRFRRGTEAAAAPGSGLGLSIARELLARGGGRMSLANTEPGLRVTVHLPIQ